MQKKANLFKLIKSLSQTEKRYFKLYCGLQKGNSNYLRLFEVIESLEEYSEAKISEMTRDETFHSHLAVTKSYLQQLILKSLRNYHEKISKDAEIGNLLLNAEILFSKELFDHCLNHLAKAEALAKKTENFTALVSIYEWRRRVFTTRFGPNHDQFKETVQKQGTTINEVQKINNYWDLLADVSSFRFQPDNEKDLMNHALIIENNPETLTAKILHNHVLYGYFLINSQPDDAEERISDIISLLETHPDKIIEEPGVYATSLGNKASLLLFQKRWQEAIKLLAQIRNIPVTYKLKRNNKFSVRTVCRSYNLELEVYRDKKEAKLGCELIKEVQVYMDQNQSAIPEDYRVLFWYQFANIYFLNAEYSQALQWVNQLMDYKKESWSALASYARILHLMIHFELGNLVFIKYALESHKRYFKKNKRYTSFEKICLNFFHSISDTPESEQKQAFQRLLNQLFVENKETISNSALDAIDIRFWIEQKLEVV
ncbi:MAG: hypothetical protein ABJH72_08730 [Reichenbachiella sp.]|uniref:hypothetical protein n=1 Tax=Reichenbachiella sp. TaxID=2184521 RepID=UPI0032969DA8